MIIEAPKSKIKWLICELLGHNYGNEQKELIRILMMGRIDLGIKPSQNTGRLQNTGQQGNC